MKQIITLLLLITVNLVAFAQSPEKISYQAIMRGQDNTLVKSSKVNLKIIIHQGSSNGTAVYLETHSVTSNSNGLVSLEIGTGTSGLGLFSAIAWEKGPFFIETQVDLTGGSNYNIIGITQLLSVPYALHAKTAERLVGSNGLPISTDLSSYATNTNLALKVDKVQGKGLSTEDYSTADKTKLASLTGKSLIITFSNSRNIVASDVNNVIECTASAILTLTSNFGAMAIGDTVNLEAHNGATLTIQATAGVSLNYTANGSAQFVSTTGNVQFGFLRKINANSYIISGQ